jgi:hypothetical protein
MVLLLTRSNLKKTQGMDTGQVGFFKGNLVKRIHVDTRRNDIVNRLNKTRREDHPDLEQERIQHYKQKRNAEKNEFRLNKQKEMEMIKQKRKEKQEWDYGKVLKEEHMYSNQGQSIEELEEDFM